MIPTLTTDRLILREITMKDTVDIFRIFSLKEVTQYYGVKTFTTLQESGNLIGTFSKSYQDRRGMRWGIERKDQKGLIGTIGFNLWSPIHRRAEIGYEIHSYFWNRGYATEAVMKIVSYGFENLKLNRIGAIVLSENEASIHLLKKLGFEEEGILRDYIYQNGESLDTYVLGLVKP
ncbi:GNAT family N-acetyltransferase [Bacillus sp. 1NLA3E]|uniref:GNAT family N-acetyltransferase n=1 Tax=Bacillus sp. 1NLA3E TaxID=666686 RepID=UPI000247F353|nr:GNAT family protein [Bacillus sp. 1NLA3E]AGK53816.1 N-acetyltransferase GCN5 [Bacillus sp. 1NLA3E]